MKIVTYHSTNAPAERCWVAHLFTEPKQKNRDKSEPNTTNDPWGWVAVTFFGETEEAVSQKAVDFWSDGEAERMEKAEKRRIAAEKRKKKAAQS